jgi:hypothetical protein
MGAAATVAGVAATGVAATGVAATGVVVGDIGVGAGVATTIPVTRTITRTAMAIISPTHTITGTRTPSITTHRTSIITWRITNMRHVAVAVATDLPIEPSSFVALVPAGSCLLRRFSAFLFSR